MFTDAHVLGLDAGAVSLSAVEVDGHGEVVSTFHEFPHGQVEACLDRILGKLDLGRIRAVATTTFTPGFISLRPSHR